MRKEAVTGKLRENKTSLVTVKATTKTYPGYRVVIMKNKKCTYITYKFSALLLNCLIHMFELLGVKRLHAAATSCDV
jgi:hypothetical protein